MRLVADDNCIDSALRQAESLIKGKAYVKVIGCDANLALSFRMSDGRHIGAAIDEVPETPVARLVADFLAHEDLIARNTFGSFWRESHCEVCPPLDAAGADVDLRATWRGCRFGRPVEKTLDYLLMDMRSGHRLSKV